MTVAFCSVKLTSVFLIPLSPSRAAFTATGQAPQVIPSTRNVTVVSLPGSLASMRGPYLNIAPALNSIDRATKNTSFLFIESSTDLHRALQNVRCELRENIQNQSPCYYDSGKKQQSQIKLSAREGAAKASTATLFPKVEIVSEGHSDHANRQKDGSVLHSNHHKSAASEAQKHNRKR